MWVLAQTLKHASHLRVHLGIPAWSNSKRRLGSLFESDRANVISVHVLPLWWHIWLLFALDFQIQFCLLNSFRLGHRIAKSRWVSSVSLFLHKFLRYDNLRWVLKSCGHGNFLRSYFDSLRLKRFKPRGFTLCIKVDQIILLGGVLYYTVSFFLGADCTHFELAFRNSFIAQFRGSVEDRHYILILVVFERFLLLLG